MADITEQERVPVSLRVVVFADFVCPYSYIGQHELQKLTQEYAVELEIRPHWLHPETPPEGESLSATVDPDRRKATMLWMKEMSPEMAELMRFPDKRYYSFFAFEAMEFARERGLSLPFSAAVFDALWVQGKDIGLLSTLEEAADKVGLDAAEMGRALRDRTYMERTVEAVVSARNIGITATPTFILGRTAVVGWHYYEALQTVVEKQGLFPKSAVSAAKAAPQPLERPASPSRSRGTTSLTR